MYKYIPPETEILQYTVGGFGPFFTIRKHGKWWKTLSAVTNDKELKWAFIDLYNQQLDNCVFDRNQTPMSIPQREALKFFTLDNNIKPVRSRHESGEEEL